MLYIYRILFDAYARFSKHNGWAFASYVALSTLTCLFPFLIFVTGLAGFLGSANLAQEAVSRLFATWPEPVGAPLAREVREALTHGRGDLLTFGGFLTLYFASSGVEALRSTLNTAYGVEDLRPWWLLRLESLAYVLLGAFALLTWAFLVVLAPLIWVFLSDLAPALTEIEAAVTVIRLTIANTVLFLALFIVHKFLPARRASLAEILPGIVLTFLLWADVSTSFGVYLAEFARNYVTTYAGLASVMIALVFLNMLASIFIFGGELNAALIRARQEAGRNERSTPRGSGISPTAGCAPTSSR